MIASPLIVHPCAIDAGAFSMLATDSRFPSFEQVAIQATSTENGTDIRFDNFLADQVG